MAKTTTWVDGSGKLVTWKKTRRQSKSEQRLIGWTAGPQTRWQKFKRDAWG